MKAGSQKSSACSIAEYYGRISSATYSAAEWDLLSKDSFWRLMPRALFRDRAAVAGGRGHADGDAFGAVHQTATAPSPDERRAVDSRGALSVREVVGVGPINRSPVGHS